MQSKKNLKRELILDTSFDLFLSKGYSNTKVVDIATKAGIGKGTVYEYFESKEAIVLELVNTRAKQDYMKVFDVVEKLPTCKEQLIQYLQMQMETTAKYTLNATDFRNEILRNNSEISTKIIEAIHSIIFLHFEFIYNVIKKGISSGEFKNLSPYMATVCFMGSINFYLGMLHHGEEYPETKMFRQVDSANGEESLLDFIFDGLLA
ncbi:MAG: TetR/AcrR family transcriptional regulator [Clostridiales bacterium]|nr:TetR/AcrR family transcriptional regulator [Clostridiales bacterium]